VTGGRPATPALERFVRETLGCTCPADVFERVEHLPVDSRAGTGLTRRIDVGGRLLIHVYEVAHPDDAVARIADWVAEGRAERERGRMNRLRLVIAADALDPAAMHAVQAAFTAAPLADERVHLHLADRKAVASL
jgi:hypothetical protein